MASRELTCALCETVFEATGTDAEAAAEYEARFGTEFRPEEAGVVCQECNQMIVDRLRNDPEFRAEMEGELGPINLDIKPAKVM